MKKLVSLGILRDLPQGKPRLVRAEGRRLACVRRGDRVDVLEDRCPHEGHPLSMGTCRDGVLTCPWHNWKFDLGTGRCLFGGESARHYPVEVVGEEVFVDLELDADDARVRREEDLVHAIADGAVDGAVREALRFARLGGDPQATFVRAACLRPPYGAGDALVAIDAAATLRGAGILDDAEAWAVMAQAVSDEARGRPELTVPEARRAPERDGFLDDLLEERRHDAVERVLATDAPVAEIVREWLVPFASIKLWDRGATLARVRAGEALATDATREAILVGLATSLGWAVAESDLPAWRATRPGLHEIARVTPGTGPLDPAHAKDLRGSEKKAVAAVLEAARAGTSPSALLAELGAVSLEHLARYELACSDRPGSAVTAYEAARAVIFAAATRPEEGRFALAHAVMLAGLLGRVARYADAEPEPPRGDLRDVVRAAALSPRCTWASRGRAASLAAACLRIGGDHAAAALHRATQLDLGGGLARVAATARHVVDGRDVDD